MSAGKPTRLRTSATRRPDMIPVKMFGRVTNFTSASFAAGSIEVNIGFGLILASVPSKSVKRAMLSSGFIILMNDREIERERERERNIVNLKWL